MKSNSRFTMSCFNCDWYYQSDNDNKEVCQNPHVLKYDMVVTAERVYCLQWKLTSRRSNTNSKLFKKKGDSISGRKKKINKARKRSS